MPRTAPLLISVVLSFAATQAFAHAQLSSPAPRNNLSNKVGPCGVARTATPLTLVAGSQLTVTWKETVAHPGHYRISFSPAGDNGFDNAANILADNIPNPAGVTATQSATVTLPSTACTDCTLQLIQVMTNTTPASNYYSCADLVLTAPNPAPTVATPAAATPSVVTGATAALSVLGADDQPATNLKYTWSAPVAPGPVTFSANGTLAARNVTATFARAGAYTLRASIADAGGKTVASTVNVTVSAPFTTVQVLPASASLPASGTRSFTATAHDQFGAALAAQPAFTWSVSGGGSVNPAGLFTAGATAGGPFTLTASSGGKSDTSMVSVVAGSAPTVATPASTPTPTVSSKTAALSVAGADDGGEGNLVYTWSAPSSPAPVAFSVNGSNAAKNVTATFSKAGAYTLVVSIKDAAGLTSTSSVPVTVAATLTTLTVTPSSATVAPSGSQAFAVSASDQFSVAISSVPSVGWTVGGGGTIAASGTFTAGSTSGGPYTVTAAAGGKSATATVTVSAALPPTFAQPAAAATPNVTSVATGLTVLGADDAGEAALTYSWASTAGPAPVTFLLNGNNAAKNTTATFSQAGAYSLEVTARDESGASATSSVSVEVAATLTAIAVRPPSTSVKVLGMQAFIAEGADQFGASLASQPAFSWSKSGGGTVTASGLFVAGATAGGPFTLTASSAGKSGTAQVMVTAADAPTLEQQASASPAQVTGRTTDLFVLGGDDGGEAGLSYTWASTAGPAPVTFSVNGTNAAKATTATFSKTGTYTLEVTLRDASNKTAVSGLMVTVVQGLGAAAISPSRVSMRVGATQPFAVTGTDQFGQRLLVEPAYSWTTTGGGTLDGAGLFHAGATPGGPFTVTAEAEGVRATAELTLLAAPADLSFPEVVLNGVVEGSILSGTVTLRAIADDDVGVTELTFALDGAPVATATRAPWSAELDTFTLSNGGHVLVAIARDAAGNATRSLPVTVRVNNGAPAAQSSGCSTTGAGTLSAALAAVAFALAKRRRRSQRHGAGRS